MSDRTWLGVEFLKLIYKDAEASEKFIEHCLTIFAISNQLEVMYGNRLEFFTKSELAELSHFPRPLPDAFISLKNSDQPRARTKHFFLEIFEDTMPFFVIVKRISQYSDYFEAIIDSPDNIEAIQKVFETNLFGEIRVTNAARKLMTQGKIIFISSIHCKLGNGRPSAIGYSASKAALDSYMKNLAKALAPDILVNSIAP